MKNKSNSDNSWQNKFQFKGLDKPPLPKEVKKSATIHIFPEAKSSVIKENSKLNACENSTTNTLESSVPKIVIDLNEITEFGTSNNEDILNNEKLNEGVSKVKARENISQNVDQKFSLSFTPGLNKRRLKRETNTTISSFAKPSHAINIQEKYDVKTVKVSETLEQTKNILIDPLNKFNKCNEDKNKNSQDSLSFLKQLGGNLQMDKQKSESSKTSSRFESKIDIKNLDNPNKAKSNTLNANKCEILNKNDYLCVEIPSFKEKLNQINKSSERSPNKTPEFKSESCSESNPQVELQKNTRKAIRKLSKNKILCTIQEETKHLSEFVPLNDAYFTPYFSTLIVGSFRKVICFQSKSITVFDVF